MQSRFAQLRNMLLRTPIADLRPHLIGVSHHRFNRVLKREYKRLGTKIIGNRLTGITYPDRSTVRTHLHSQNSSLPPFGLLAFLAPAK